MKSLFLRSFVMYAAVIVLGFTILGSVFTYQTVRFSIKEKQTIVERTSGRAVQSTQAYLELIRLLQGSMPGWSAQFERTYRVNMEQLSADIEGWIFVTSTEGELLYIANRDGCYAQMNGAVPQAATSAVLQNGMYSEITNFAGYFSEPNYILGSPVKDETGNLMALVFVAVEADSSLELFRTMRFVFVALTVTVLLVTLLVTMAVVRSTVRPLKQMADSAKRFALGDFSARVPLPKRRDELYEMTRSFNQMAESIENMEENRRGLIASVSHDLRTPMTTIAGFVDGILDGTIKPDKQAYYLRIISEEIKRLSRLATGMLEASRYEATTTQLHPSMFDLSEMLRRIVIGFQQKIDEKAVDVKLDIPDVCSISADRDAMFQVIYNLVDNAVKFVDLNGQITIYMALKGGKVQFNIINTGSEIDPERLNKIFDRFYKGDDSRLSSKTGAGLGLYIVKTIVNRHGGDVVARSGGGKTEFCFTVPAAQAQ